jgi:hypothetical protein
VIFAKSKCSAPLDYRRLKLFNILKISDNDKAKLIVSLKPGKTNIQYYVTNDELFNILFVLLGPVYRKRIKYLIRIKF